MSFGALLDPATSAALDLIHDASTEHTWLPAAAITLLRVLPGHIVQQIHGYLHVPVVPCSSARIHPAQSELFIDATEHCIAIQAWSPCDLLDVFASEPKKGGATRLRFIDGGTESCQSVYDGPIDQVRATSETLAAAVNKIAIAAKWIAEREHDDYSARVLEDIANLRDLSPISFSEDRFWIVFVSEGWLITKGPELCSRCRGTA